MIVSETVMVFAEQQQVRLVVTATLRSEHDVVYVKSSGAALVESETERPGSARTVTP